MAEIETNPLFPILTDALRAGPGSPEWHQAIAKLRAEGLADSDEYRLLVAVREHLAAGRDYRSIRAGPGFTRKVMEGIERERQAAKKPSGMPLATIIAVASVAVILAIAAYVIYRVVPWGGGVPTDTAEQLEKTFFPKELYVAKFESAAPIPTGWREFGRLPLEATKAGLAPVISPTGLPGGPAGKAVVTPQQLPGDQPFAVEVKLKPGKPGDDLIVQVFASSEADFNDAQGTSSNEMLWLLQGVKHWVVSQKGNETQRNREPVELDSAARAESIAVRLLVNRDLAVVVVNGKQVYAGPHGLGTKPRNAGVRFLRADPSKPVDPTAIQSISVRVLN